MVTRVVLQKPCTIHTHIYLIHFCVPSFPFAIENEKKISPNQTDFDRARHSHYFLSFFATTPPIFILERRRVCLVSFIKMSDGGAWTGSFLKLSLIIIMIPRKIIIQKEASHLCISDSQKRHYASPASGGSPISAKCLKKIKKYLTFKVGTWSTYNVAGTF